MAKLIDPSAERRPVPRLVGGGSTFQPADTSAVGKGLMSVGNDLVASSHEFAAQQEKLDTVRVEDAWNRYKNQTLDLTHGENGFFKKKGAEAINGNMLSTLNARLSDSARLIDTELQNDEQRTRFRQRVQATDLHVKQQALEHLDREYIAYQKTTLEGTIGAAKSQIVAAPTSVDVFANALYAVQEQRKVYLKNHGITGEKEVQAALNADSDVLWATRIDTLLYSNPTLADAVLRASADQIHNPELRLKLQHQTREAALAVASANEGARIVQEVRDKVPPAQVIETGGPRSFRNNNPGNIEKSSYRWPGEVDGPDTRFVRFATWEDGLAAMRQNLMTYQNKHGLRTVEGIINRWAPASENGQESTSNYVKAVAKALGVKPDEKINLSDPATMTKMVEAMTKVESGGVQRVPNTDPMVQNTSGLPHARDVAAQLPFMLMRIEKRADELYGKDVNNPDRAAFIRRTRSEIHSRVAEDVQSLNAIQREAQGVLIDAIIGQAPSATTVMAAGQAPTGASRPGAPGTTITSIGQIFADPKLARAWQMSDPQVKVSMMRLIEQNGKEDQRGDVQLYRDVFNRIHLDPGDPRKINFYSQIVDPAIADRLSRQQINELYVELNRSESPGGRSAAGMRKAAETNVASYFKTHLMFTAQPDRQLMAIMRWNEDVGKKVDDYVKAGKDVRSLFSLESPDSMVNEKALSLYVNSTPAMGLSSAAVKAAPIAPAAQPSSIKTSDELHKWFQTLPANVTMFTGTDGVVRYVPGRKPQGGPAETVQQPVSAPVTPTAPVVTPTGKVSAPTGMVEPGNIDLGNRKVLKNADGTVSTERSMSFNDGQFEVLIPTVSADGKRILSDAEAIDQYSKSGQHLGKFSSPQAATTYARDLSAKQAARYAVTEDTEPKAEDFAIRKPMTVAESLQVTRNRQMLERESARIQLEARHGNLSLSDIAYAIWRITPPGMAFGGASELGHAIGQGMRTERDVVLDAWAQIKRTRQVGPEDLVLLQQALQHGLPTTKDEALARKLIKRLEGD